MTDVIEDTYNQMLDKGGSFAYLENVYFDALLTCTNPGFLAGIKIELSKWESGQTMIFEDIKSDALLKLNNICEQLKKDNKNFSGQTLNAAANPIKSADSNSSNAKLVVLATDLYKTKQELEG